MNKFLTPMFLAHEVCFGSFHWRCFALYRRVRCVRMESSCSNSLPPGSSKKVVVFCDNGFLISGTNGGEHILQTPLNFA